jgi:hypothetical protein
MGAGQRDCNGTTPPSGKGTRCQTNHGRGAIGASQPLAGAARMIPKAARRSPGSPPGALHAIVVPIDLAAIVAASNSPARRVGDALRR